MQIVNFGTKKDFYKDLTPGVILYNNSGRVATQIKTQESLK